MIAETPAPTTTGAPEPAGYDGSGRWIGQMADMGFVQYADAEMETERGVLRSRAEDSKVRSTVAVVLLLLAGCTAERVPFCMADGPNAECEPGYVARCAPEEYGIRVFSTGECGLGLSAGAGGVPVCDPEVTCGSGGEAFCIRDATPTAVRCAELVADCSARGGSSTCLYLTDRDGEPTGTVEID